MAVAEVQKTLAGQARRTLAELLTIPLGDCENLSAEQIQQELDNNAQGMLGYVVRWLSTAWAAPKYQTSTMWG